MKKQKAKIKSTDTEKDSPKARVATNTQRSAKAFLRYVRISPRKVRLVLDEIRHKPTVRAFVILTTINKKGARLAEKLLKSAVANAKDIGLEEGKLVVADIRADGGPVMKRFMPRSMGRADRILKRTAHLSVVVKEGEKNWLKKTEVVSAQEDEVDSKGRKKKVAKSQPTKKKAAAAKA